LGINVHTKRGRGLCCGSGYRIQCLFDPGIRGWVKIKIRTGSGMNIPDHIPESFETIFWVKKKNT